MSPRTSLPAWWPAIFVLLVTAAGLAVSLASAPLGDLGVEADFFAELAPAAQELAAGRFAVANHPFKGPLHAFLLVPLHAALAPLDVGWYRSAVVLSLLAAAGTLLLVHRLALRLAGPRAAVVVLLVTASVKVFFIHAHKASSDQLFLLCVMASVAALLLRPPRPAAWLLSGALAGLAWLTRDNGIVVAVWAAAVLLLVDPWRLPWRRRALAVACVWAGFLLVASPWLAASRAQTGHWLASRNLQNIVDEFYGGERADMVPPGGFRSLGQVVAQDPVYFVVHYLGNLPRHLGQDLDQVTGRTFGAVALAALALLAWRRPDRRQVAVLLLGVVMFLALGSVFHRPRFSLPLVPVWALVTALGIERLPRLRTVAAVAVVALVMALHGGHIARAVSFYDRQQPRHLSAAIAAAPQWSAGARGRDGRPAVLMARKAHLAHYAGLRFAAYPAMARDQQDLVDRARASGATFLAVGAIEREYLPDAAMLDHLDNLPGVSVAWRDAQTLVYRVDAAASGGD
ncbi:MAG: glycosyltransferase family 39 protein [bacterium]|nr:glycosyltransferase family 39 protein [bacterium]